MQTLNEKRELEHRKKDAEVHKQHESVKITPPVSSPEDNGNTVPGMPPVSTEYVIYPELLEIAKLGNITEPHVFLVPVPM